MISLKIVDVKKFTKNLLIDSVFDNFCTSSVIIDTFNKFSIDGRINLEWYTKDEREEIAEDYTKWYDMKKYAYDIIKGNRVPISFKIVLLLSKENTANMLSKYSYQISDKDVDGFFLNILYDNNEVRIVTGMAYKTFIMDKTIEKEWDNSIKIFLNKNEIEYDEQ